MDTILTIILFAGVRLEINLGELLDFVLGWTTLDIFNDDIGHPEFVNTIGHEGTS